MRILLVADGRSPITRRWISGLQSLQHQVVLASTFPCAPIPGVDDLRIFPVAFSGVRRSGSPTATTTAVGPSAAGLRGSLLAARDLLGPYSLPFYAQLFRKLVAEIKPDLVHALRIPFEGMLAAYSPVQVPLVISIWGNDLTLHAPRSARMSALTQCALQRADALMADAQRDISLASQWGFPVERPSQVVPGGGGVDLSEMHNQRSDAWKNLCEPIPAGAPLVVNPRGIRPAYVRNEVFFQAVPLILERNPDVIFLCPGMAGKAEALQWVQTYKLEKVVRLLPTLPQPQLWDLFLQAQVSVSISVHDGTPNTFLESIACGCFPIVGDIESLREWITPGVNGLLVEPGKAQSTADALVLALSQPELRQKAAEINRRLVLERADQNMVRAQIQVFYQRVTAAKKNSNP
jgi:glycosyltransferase involved in cell wall biosynthesis